jgi:protein arginine kinase activator
MNHKILCDICQEKLATVHYTEIVENKLKKMDLCEDCAKQKNIGINIQFSVADILKGLTESHIEKKEETAKKCPFCGLTFAMFRKTGKLGCGECYDVFADQLLPIINDIHKNEQHVGTKPAGTPSRQRTAVKNKVRLDELAAELEEAVKNEKYEEAAVLRDKMKSLQEKVEKKGKGK